MSITTQYELSDNQSIDPSVHRSINQSVDVDLNSGHELRLILHMSLCQAKTLLAGRWLAGLGRSESQGEVGVLSTEYTVLHYAVLINRAYLTCLLPPNLTCPVDCFSGWQQEGPLHPTQPFTH